MTNKPEVEREPAVLVRVTLGQIPRDTSPAEGQVVRVSGETARQLLESGQAVPVRDAERERT